MTHGVKMSVSVIVPVYNAERFLDQCLLSIRNQSGCDLEVICVNDGSTDRSPEILRRHSAEDSRVRVVDKENGGYGSACNRGLAEARGEWVSIVEPDDWIEPGMYGDMLSFARTFDSHVDIVKTPWWNINDWDCPGADQYRTGSPLPLRLSQSTRPFSLCDHPELIEYHPSIWSALYSRSFMLDKAIRFIEYPGAGWADNPFLIDTLCQAGSIAYLDKAYYCYRLDPPGSTRNHSTEAAVLMPFERWLAMLERLRSIGVSDRGVIESHYIRGFKYVEGAIHDDGADNPLVQDGAKRVFASMDPELVMSSCKIDPRRKRFFCSVMGLNYSDGHALASLMYSMREQLMHLRCLGIKGIESRVRYRLLARF